MRFLSFLEVRHVFDGPYEILTIVVIWIVQYLLFHQVFHPRELCKYFLHVLGIYFAHCAESHCVKGMNRLLIVDYLGITQYLTWRNFTKTDEGLRVEELLDFTATVSSKNHLARHIIVLFKDRILRIVKVNLHSLNQKANELRLTIEDLHHLEKMLVARSQDPVTHRQRNQLQKRAHFLLRLKSWLGPEHVVTH